MNTIVFVLFDNVSVCVYLPHCKHVHTHAQDERSSRTATFCIILFWEQQQQQQHLNRKEEAIGSWISHGGANATGADIQEASESHYKQAECFAHTIWWLAGRFGSMEHLKKLRS